MHGKASGLSGGRSAVRTAFAACAIGIAVMLAACPDARSQNGARHTELRFVAPAVRTEVAPLVEALAGANGLESERVGVAGAPSEAWKRAHALFAAANADEIVSLAMHPSPVVRAWMIRRVVEVAPGRAAALAPLLRDRAIVRTVQECSISDVAISALTVRALAALKSEPAIQSVLSAAAADPEVGVTRAEILPLLPPREAFEAARALAGSDEESLRAAAVDALASSAADRGTVIALRGDASFHVRGAVARALGTNRSEEARDALVVLLHDDNAWVRGNAARSYLAEPGRETGPVAAAMNDGPEGRAIPNAIADIDRPEVFAILDGYVRTHPREASTVMGRIAQGAPSPARTRLLVDRLRAEPDAYWRVDVTRYLARIGSREHLDLFRQGLRANNDVHTQAASAEAIVALRDTASIPQLTAMLDGANAYTRFAGAHALINLGAPGAREAILAAADRHADWGAEPLRAIAQGRDTHGY